MVRFGRGGWLLPVAALAAIGAAVLVAFPVSGGLRPQALQTGAQVGLPFGTGEPSAAAPTTNVTQTPQVTPTAQATPQATPTPQAIPGDPAETVVQFYRLVQRHQFGSAAQLWSEQMQADYPPAEFIDQRFAQTRQLKLREARVIASDGGVATVAVDVVEVAADARRRWAGTWQLVLTPAGWLLNQPNLGAFSPGSGD